jgi:hypothetical protein
MRAKKHASFKGQLDLFPEAMRPTAEKFAANLFSNALVSKTVSRKRFVPGKPKTIKVLEEIKKAYSLLEGKQGVNVQELVKLLESSQKIKVEDVLRNEKIFVQLNRGDRERAQIKKAMGIIARFVNRKKGLDALRKTYAGTPREYAERSRMQRHLKGIAGRQ